jgi:hypothetical protein
MSEERLREKLRKIEALYAGATTAGEKSAAGAAAERIRCQFEVASKKERAEEFKFSILTPGRVSSSSPYVGATASSPSAIPGCTVRPLWCGRQPVSCN